MNKFRLTDKPCHRHDCSHCAYLGTLVNAPDTERFDIYHHAGGAEGGTLIARYGQYGDYYSSPVSLLAHRVEDYDPDYILVRALHLLRVVEKA